MINETELKILKKLFEDLTEEFTIRALASSLRLPYHQIHRSVKSLKTKVLINVTKKGKSSIVSLDFKIYRDEYLITEIERKKEAINKRSILKILDKDLDKIRYNQYVCILFGSYANKNAKKDSDIDLLFIIPEEYSYEKFEKNIKNMINISNADINITTEKGLVDMWNTPSKFNVGNEILKKHIILRGAEAFLHLRRKYYVG